MGQYNTQLVVLAVAILGLAAGVVGSFLLLRKQSLMGDALSHATLPGITIAYLVMIAFGGSGKHMLGLLAGATVSGVLGVWTVNGLTRYTRLKDDAAMGVVLSVFFGLGVALLTVVQQTTSGSAAGLTGFIYGKTASMLQRDLWLIIIASVMILLVSALLLKELTLFCFDHQFARTQGWPVRSLDLLVLVLITAVTVVGLQAVGLILILAFLITPPAAARFWTRKLKTMLILSAVIGSLSGALGAWMSAVAANMPSGAVIVLTVATVFLFSMFFGTQRGVLVRMLKRNRLQRTVERQHLLRLMYETLHPTSDSTNATDLATSRSVDQSIFNHTHAWPKATLKRALNRAVKDGLIRPVINGQMTLTDNGYQEAARVTRNHRLWEIYLITHADVAPSQVDRDADRIEHVLSAELIRKLETKLAGQMGSGATQVGSIQPGSIQVPESPHALTGGQKQGAAPS